MSAAVVISPMLITFLGIDAYQAIGIALASDVLASAISAYEYKKNKNLDVKNGLIMMITVMIFTFIASFLSKFVSGNTMGGFSMFMTLFLGIKFIIRPVMTTKEKMMNVDAKKRVIQSVISGIVIGSICGFIGAASHFYLGGMPDIKILIMCMLSTLIFARIAAIFANKASAKTLNRALGIILTVLSVAIIFVKLFQ